MLALITAIVVAAAPANAAPVKSAPAARPVDAATLAAATRLVEQLDVRGQLQRSLMGNVAAMRSGAAIRSMLAQQPGFIGAYQANRARFDPALKKAGAIQADVSEKIIRENTPAAVKEAALAYARNYTLAELQGLSAFYRTPLGQAFNAKQGKVSGEVVAGTGRVIGQKIDAGMEAAAPRLQAALAPLNAAPLPAAKK
jgi:hypothetical protein